MVIIRISTLTILSTMGIKMMRPGPFVAIILPKRNITPRSYSLSTLIAAAKNKTTKTIMVIVVYIV